MSSQSNNFLRQDRVKKLLILALFVSGIALFFLFEGYRYLTPESLIANRSRLLEFTESHLLAMWFGWALFFCVIMLFGLPFGALLSLATGLLFGRWGGTLLLVLSGTVSATMVFLAARYLFAETARKRLESYPFTAKILDGFHADGFHYLLFLRLVPLFPFWPVNLVPAFTKIPATTFVTATLVGMIPGSFVFASLGDSLQEVEKIEQMLSFEIIAALGALGILALFPVVLKKLRSTSRG